MAHTFRTFVAPFHFPSRSLAKTVAPAIRRHRAFRNSL